MNIDLNRGVSQRKHPGGYLVSMYKDQPGTYLFENGSVCTEREASEAGFDVEAHDKARRKTELMAVYKQKLDRMMAQELKKLEEQIETELSEEQPEDSPAADEPSESEPDAETVGPKPHKGWGKKKEAGT